MDAADDYEWGTVVIGADLDAVRFAHDNKYFLIKNRSPYHHSYESAEQEWAEKIYQLYEMALVPFTDKSKSIRIYPEEKILKVFTDRDAYTVKYEKLYLFDDENVEGMCLDKKLIHYRVLDWFDCQGLQNVGFEEITTDDKFVSRVKLFKSLRIDGNRKYLDLVCESFLTEEQLKSFDYSDTMAKFKVVGLLQGKGIANARASLWKREIYPIYDTIY